MPALGFVFLTAILYSFHSVCIKAASGKIDPFFGMLFWILGGAAVILPVILFRIMKEANEFSLHGAVFFACAGAMIAAGTMFYFISFERGINFSLGVPIVNITVVIGGVLFGILLFSETVSLIRLFGALLGCISVVMIAKG